MYTLRLLLIVNVFPIALGSMSTAAASGGTASTPVETAATDESHAFDFEFGEWHVDHRVKRPDGSWLEFDGTCTTRPLAGGLGNIEEHVFIKPTGLTRGVGLRAFNPATKEWAIWWIDARGPHGALDPPVKRRFEAEVGTFISEGVLNGKMTRTRYRWSLMTATSAHWEQAYSEDAGKTWDTNWIMEFRRIP